MSHQDVKFCFVVDWYDTQSTLIKQFQLFYYPKDNSVEMYDVKNKKKFFNRARMDSVKFEELYLGNRVNVCSRILNITDYGDTFTRNALTKCQQRTCAMIKPDGVKNCGKIISLIEKSGVKISGLKMVQLTKQTACQFYAEHKGREFYERLTDFMSSGPIIAMGLIGDNAIKKWRDLMGPTNTQTAQKEAPKSLRAMFGTDGTKNAVHGSDSYPSASRELDFFFGDKSLNSQQCKGDSTLCVIKPHMLVANQLGSAIQDIVNEGYVVNQMNMFNLDLACATEFLAVYKGILPEYGALVEELCTGPCVALEICCEQNSVDKFRGYCGPHDPVIAQHLAPNSIRAKYGLDRVRNGLHCTDLPEDGLLEVEFFFNILAGNE